MRRQLSLSLFVLLLTACGGAGTRETERPREAPPVRLLAEDLDARPPLSAVALEARDAAVLVASSEKAESVLGWKREYPDIRQILEDAHQWRGRFPTGYGS